MGESNRATPLETIDLNGPGDARRFGVFPSRSGRQDRLWAIGRRRWPRAHYRCIGKGRGAGGVSKSTVSKPCGYQAERESALLDRPEPATGPTSGRTPHIGATERPRYASRSPKSSPHHGTAAIPTCRRSCAATVGSTGNGGATRSWASQPTMCRRTDRAPGKHISHVGANMRYKEKWH